MPQIKTLLALAYFSLGAQAVSGFGASCNSWGVLLVKTPYTLDANCRRTNGGYMVDTELTLNKCMGNNNGQLVYQVNGGWDGSCRVPGDRASSQFTGTVFHAQCKTAAGQYVDTSIDLKKGLHDLTLVSRGLVMDIQRILTKAKNQPDIGS